MNLRNLLIALLAWGVCAGTLLAQGGGLQTMQDYQTLKDQGKIPASYTGFAQSLAQPSKNVKPPLGAPKSGPCDCWIAPDATYTLAMPPNDDGSSGMIPLPFSFNLYGTNYTSLYINNNGNVSFGAPYGAFSSSAFPNANFVMVAPFWGDVDTRPAGGGSVWYKVTPTAIYVNWVAVGYYSMQTNMLNSFQLILTDGNDPNIGIGKNVQFCYQDMQWTTGSASGGTGGFGGTPSTVGANRGNGIDYIQFGRFNAPGTLYFGPLAGNSQVSWLDYKNFTFTTAVSTSNIPPIGTGTYLCDTLETCAGMMNILDMTFLSPEPGQTTTAITSCATLSNYTTSSYTPGNTCQITGQFTPLPTELGYHQVLFEATDNGTPPLTATYYIVVHVFPAAATASGSVTVCSAGPPVNLFAQLSPALTPGGTWVNPSGVPHSGTLQPSTDPSGDYIYNVGTGAGCPSTGTVTVTNILAPNAGNNAVLNTCNSNPPTDLSTLIGVADPGGYWSAPGGGAMFSPVLDPAFSLPGNYTYTVLGNAPCGNDVASVTVNIALAVDAGVDATVALCTDAAPLNMLGALGGSPDASGQWTSPSGAPFGGTFNASVDQPGVYTYFTPAVAPCASDQSELTITVDPQPNSGSDALVEPCADAPNIPLFPLLGPADAGGTWLNPNGVAFGGTLQPIFELSGDYLYVTYGIGACVHLTDTAVVTANIGHMPEVAFTAEPLAGCAPLDVYFDNQTPPAHVGQCAWSFGNGSSGTNTGDFNFIYGAPGHFTVTLTVTSPEGCVTTLTKPQYILVQPPPQATFTAYPNPATVDNNNVSLASTDPLAVQWAWDIGGLDSAFTRNVLHPFPNVLGGEYEVCLTVWDIYGCEDTECQTVIVKNPLAVYVPNAFSPNGDGVNDDFYPLVSGNDEKQFKLYVFDRWGSMIFESTDQYERWNGGYRNSGEVLPNGVYVWRLITMPEDGGGRKEYTGHVTLIK
ncbi:MAG: gliding motility-associated C-terminal domain-containing protein [Flavobacteriales bacterium]|nr:gliding motility-associated C-terminal domain-containing protein [Flavobacteriales bacterium]